jgi:hypothetical protein
MRFSSLLRCLLHLPVHAIWLPRSRRKNMQNLSLPVELHFLEKYNSECVIEFTVQITLASFLSLAIKSSTDSTFLPASRLAGSETETICSVGFTSTLKSPGVNISIGFFLAFMILGSVAKRGSFNLPN